MNNKRMQRALCAGIGASALVGSLHAEAPSNAEFQQVITDLQTAWEIFQSENNEQIAALQRGQADVVKSEKVDRINDSLGDLQAELDKLNERMANQSLNAGQSEIQGADPEYVQAYERFFRTGKGEDDVEAAQYAGVRAAMEKGSDPDGGYLAPIEWDRTISDKLKIVSRMRGMARVQNISGTSYTKLYNDRATASGWVGETAARPATGQAQLAPLQFDTGEIYAMPSATQTILDDALINVPQWLADEVETEFAYQEGIAFVSGDGTNGRPFGFLTYVTGAANAAKHPWGAIELVNSGAAAALTGDGLIDLVYSLASERAANANFAMNRTTQGSVRKLKDGEDNYLWKPGIESGQPATLLGYPVEELAAMPNIAANSTPIAFGDFNRGYLIVDRVGIRVLRDPYTNKPYVNFYTTKRVGGGVNDPEAIKVQQIAA